MFMKYSYVYMHFSPTQIIIQNSVQSRLVEFQEENNSLRSKIRSLEVASQGVTEQEKLIGGVSTLWIKSFE